MKVNIEVSFNDLFCMVLQGVKVTVKGMSANDADNSGVYVVSIQKGMGVAAMSARIGDSSST